MREPIALHAEPALDSFVPQLRCRDLNLPPATPQFGI